MYWAIENMFAMTDDKGDIIKIKTTPAQSSKEGCIDPHREMGII